MTPVLVFDIETVPDLVGGRRLLDLDGASDDEVATAMSEYRMAKKGTDFQPAHLQRIVAISVCLRKDGELKVWSLGDEGSSEAELVRRFFDGVDRLKPTLVSWNGSGFDLPVLHYRALIHGIAAPRYWDTGHSDRETKWDNYIGRYHFRHTDVMDVLALYSSRNYAPLSEIAQLLGYPGKLGMDGSMVFDTWRDGGIADIRAYCETDVVNTYLVYLRFQRFRGLYTADELADEEQRVRDFLRANPAEHWAEFDAAWPEHDLQ